MLNFAVNPVSLFVNLPKLLSIGYFVYLKKSIPISDIVEILTAYELLYLIRQHSKKGI